MNARQPVFKICVLFFISLFLGACGSYRIASTLKPSGETQLLLGQARFSLVRFSARYDENNPGAKYRMEQLTTEFLNERAKTLYPELFTDEWTALPVVVRVEAKYEERVVTGAILTALTAGVIPFPCKMTTDLSVTADLLDAGGDSLVAGDMPFQIEEAVWVSLIGPLGCIPVPGEADSRGTMFLFIPITGPGYSTAQAEYNNYLADRLVEAVVRKLRAGDPSVLNTAYEARATRLREVLIDGRTAWSFLALRLSTEDNKAESFSALFYRDYPNRSSQPFEEVIVARRGAGNQWIPTTGYLRNVQELTAVTALMDTDGVPARVVVKKVAEPPVEDFIDLPDNPIADDIRWSNRILIEAKNTSLLRLMQQGSRQELGGLITQVEKNVLALSEKAQMADSQVQQIVINGGDPKAVNEMAVLYRQRITILEAVLSALKRAGAR